MQMTKCDLIRPQVIIGEDLIKKRPHAHPLHKIDNIINLSHCCLCVAEMKVLGRGLSFVPKPRRICKDRQIADFDQFVSKLRFRYKFRGVPIKKI